MGLLVDIWTQMEIIPRLRNVKKKRIVREKEKKGEGERKKEIISIQINRYKKSFHLVIKCMVHIHDITLTLLP